MILERLVYLFSVFKLYVCRVISSVLFEAPELIGFYPALGGFAAFLLALQVLHIFWTIQIIRTAVKPFTTGQVSVFSQAYFCVHSHFLKFFKKCTNILLLVNYRCSK